ncbi:MAG TPA: hypothetical protein VKB62_02720, partial [Streptosporangiaceae bacterium]|nr:hypothetical protein [Streptosporangiaceae bacterium]
PDGQPPADDGQPTDPPPPRDDPPSPRNDRPYADDGQPADDGLTDGPPPRPEDRPPDPGSAARPDGADGHPSGLPADCAGPGDASADSGPAGSEPAGSEPAGRPGEDRSPCDDGTARGGAPGGSSAGPAAAGCDADPPPGAGDLPGWWPDIPCPGDADAPPDTGEPPDPVIGLASQPDDDDDDWPQLPSPDWPALPALLPVAGDPAPAHGDAARARAGLLDVLLPWSSLAGDSREPGLLGRIGPISVLQARQLLYLAVLSPSTQWRVIVTGDDGRAVAVERARPPWQTHAPDTAPNVTGVVGRVTVTFRASALTTPAVTPPAETDGCPPLLRGIAAMVLRTASRAAARARTQAERDADASGCAHTTASASYRPPPRVREHVAARDKTCRFGPCGQPAWRTDIDHTIPWHKGGRTCRCNLGGCCRTHHLIKHLPGWQLEQPQPGNFRWTTPAGRSYLVKPDPYPV